MHVDADVCLLPSRVPKNTLFDLLLVQWGCFFPPAKIKVKAYPLDIDGCGKATALQLGQEGLAVLVRRVQLRPKHVVRWSVHVTRSTELWLRVTSRLAHHILRGYCFLL